MNGLKWHSRRAERLIYRLLHCPPRRQRNSALVPRSKELRLVLRIRVILLSFLRRQDAVYELVPKAVQGGSDASHLHQIGSDSVDHRV